MHQTDLFKKIEKNPQLAQDVINYAKYLILQGTDDNNVDKLNELLEHGDFPQFLRFGDKYAPQFAEKIMEYVENYSASE